MPLTFAQLVQPLTTAQITAQCLAALQGLGVVVPANSLGGVPVGTGSVALSGSPTLNNPFTSPVSCIAKVTTSGEPGAAQVQVSTDGGTTYAAAVTVPSNGVVAVTGTQGATGVTATFTAGPVGAGTSFILGDTFSFTISTPTFPVTSWQAGSTPRVLVNIDAQVLAAFSQAIAAIAAGGLASTATSAWADLFGQNQYGLTRNPSVSTVGLATLTDAAAQGPFTILIGQLTCASASGQLYQNSNGGTLPKSGTLQLSWQALTPGAAANVGNGGITTLSTPLPGVTINNPDPGSGTWITTQGADQELDGAYMARCTGRWSTVGVAASAAGYDSMARTADASITRTLVQTDPVVGGQANIYCAGTSGPAGGGAVTNAQNYLNLRIPLTTIANVVAATAVPITVTATVFYYAAKTTLAAVQAAAAANLNSLFANGPFGIDAGGSVKMYLSAIIEQLQLPTGVRNVTVSLPAADVALTTGQIATLTQALTFTAV